MKQPTRPVGKRRRISDEILSMIERSATTPPPTRANELAFEFKRLKAPQDVVRVRPPRNPRIWRDEMGEMNDPENWLPGEKTRKRGNPQRRA